MDTLKTRDALPVIECYVDLVEAGGTSSGMGTVLRALSAILKRSPNIETSVLAQRLARLANVPTGHTETTNRTGEAVQILRSLEALHELLSVARSPRLARAVEELIEPLKKFESASTETMLERLRKALSSQDVDPRIAEYVAKLRAAQGDEVAFDRTLSELEKSDVSRESVVKIACEVYASIAKSTSRKAAIAYIRKPHDALVSARRGIKAMGGRSAA